MSLRSTGENVPSTRQGSPLVQAGMPDQLDSVRLLDGLHEIVTNYCVLPSSEHEDAVVLWIVVTHCVPAFDYAPRLVIRSAEKRSGKSRLLEIIDGTCHQPLRAVNATVPAIFRSLGGDHPRTLLLDEADTIFGSKRAAEYNEDLRGLLNAGFQRGLPVLRTVGRQHEPKEFPTFAMAALAGIGKMPDTIEDRAVVVLMRRRKPSDHVQPFRLRRDQPALLSMRRELGDWARQQVEKLSLADPLLPVEDRAADTWAPLVAVADLVGGDWPERARRAAVKLTTEAEAKDAESSNVRLLSDIREVFDNEHARFMKSSRLCQELRHIADAPWRDLELNPHKLGHRLSDYGIRTGHNTSRTERGYRIQDFSDAFERYLPGHPSKTVQSVRPPTDLRKGLDPSAGTDGSKPSGESSSPQKPGRSDTVKTQSDGSGRELAKLEPLQSNRNREQVHNRATLQSDPL